MPSARSHRLPPNGCREVRRAIAPLSPQLATLGETPPGGDGWLHEIKLDGYRILAHVSRGVARLFTRNGHDWTDRLPVISSSIAALPATSAVIDGEAVVFDPDGRSSFVRLQTYFKTGRPPVAFCAFDLLELDGTSLAARPEIEREELLQHLLRDAPQVIRYNAHVLGHGERVLEEACRMGLEGIVSKRIDAPYRPSRQRTRIKTKCIGRDEFVIVGYQKSNKRDRPFASLLIADHEDRKLIYRGRVGTGFDGGMASELMARFARLTREMPAVGSVPRTLDRVRPRCRDLLSRDDERRRAAPSRVPGLARGQAGSCRANAAVLAARNAELRRCRIPCAPEALRLAAVRDPLPHLLLMLDQVMAHADEFDVLPFHVEPLEIHKPGERGTRSSPSRDGPRTEMRRRKGSLSTPPPAPSSRQGDGEGIERCRGLQP